MRALVFVRAREAFPIELAPAMAQGFRQWRDQYRNQLKEFAWFAGGNGGCAIAEVSNETELFQMMISWPLNAFSEIDVYPLVDGDEALDFWATLLESRSGG